MKQRYNKGMAIYVLSAIGICVGIYFNAIYQWLCIGAVTGVVVDELLQAIGFGREQ